MYVYICIYDINLYIYIYIDIYRYINKYIEILRKKVLRRQRACAADLPVDIYKTVRNASFRVNAESRGVAP